MGYYSNVMIATTKKDFEKIKKAQDKFEINLFNLDTNITAYKENDKDCIFFTFYSIKYYKQFEEIQELEKSLGRAKEGYVFCRMGEENGDIEFRKRSNLPELMSKFDFIQDLKRNLDKELGEEEEEFE